MARTAPSSVRETMAEKRKARRAAGVQVADVAETVPAEDAAPDTRTPFVMIAHGKIRPDPDNARKQFDHDALVDLACTIASHGLLQPLVVTAADAEGIHTLVAGERRWRAIELLIEDGPGRWAEDKPIPCRLETAEDQARMEAALIENLQRVDLNHMEAGIAFETLGSRFHLSNKTISEKIGRSPEYVQQHRRLAGLNEEEQEEMRRGELTMHDALQILAKPKVSGLPANQVLILAEVAWAQRIRPMKGHYQPTTECAYDALGGHLEQLRNTRMIDFGDRHWESQRATISVGWAAYQAPGGDELRLIEKGPIDDAKMKLREIRHAAGGDEAACRDFERFMSPFLNGPFPLHPDAEATLERRRTEKADQKAATIAAKAKRERALAKIEALSKRAPGPAIETSIMRAWEDDVAALLGGHMTLPVHVDGNNRVIDAKGKTICDPNWQFGDDRIALAGMIAFAINFAGHAGIQPSGETHRDEGVQRILDDRIPSRQDEAA